MRKQLFKDIVSCLSSITKTEGGQEVPVFKMFDLWNQQVEFLQEEKPIVWPAIFIEFEPCNWTSIGYNVQSADTFVKIHVVTSQMYGNTRSNAPEDVVNKALEYLDAVDLVNKALTNFAPSSGNRFQRDQSTPNHNHEKIIDSIERFKCNVIDRSGMPDETTVTASLSINHQ